jgi:hypothetical protein
VGEVRPDALDQSFLLVLQSDWHHATSAESNRRHSIRLSTQDTESRYYYARRLVDVVINLVIIYKPPYIGKTSLHPGQLFPKAEVADSFCGRFS